MADKNIFDELSERMGASGLQYFPGILEAIRRLNDEQA